MVVPPSLTTLSAILPTGYGLVLLECILVGLCCTLEMIPVAKLRKQLFTRAFHEQHFPQIKHIKSGGYPDGGQGRFSDKLPDDQWIAFNNAQRVHANNLESFAQVIINILIGGLVYTRVTLLLGLVYVVGRIIYGIGYRASGPSGRTFGARIFEIALFGLLFTAIASAVQIAGGFTGIAAFFTHLF